jgi:ElaB/YqjD/DUF883 family membrane-anchored ribosome-binding protein
MDDDPEVIRHQMEETRSSLTDKIERLEQTVTEKVHTTTAAVTDTVESVRGAVRDTVDSVRGTVTGTVETVKETFDVRRYFEKYPWAALGAAVGVGFVGGAVLGAGGRRRDDRIPTLHSRGEVATEPPVSSHGHHGHNGGPKRRSSASSRATHAASSVAHEISSKFGDEIGKLKGVALGAMFGLVRDWIGRSATGDVGRQIAEVIDDVTRKLGGQPIRGNLLESFGNLGGHGKASRERETPAEMKVGGRMAAEPEY